MVRSWKPGGAVALASGHASIPKGLIGDREASDLAPVQRSWTAGTKVADSGSSVEEARRSGCPGGQASAPPGPVSDRKASDLAPYLSGATGLLTVGCT